MGAHERTSQRAGRYRVSIQTMSYVDASQFVQVPQAFMNADHAEEIALLERLGESLEAHRAGRGGVEAVVERVSLLAVHMRENFLREESAMREAGYPAYAAHKAEHDRILAEMDAEVRRFRESGDAARLRAYLFESVPTWFVVHIRTMDLVTARFLESKGR